MIRSILALFIAYWVFAPIFAKADAVSDARKQIEAAYQRENAAAMRKDVNGILANLAPDYETTNMQGIKAGREQMKQMLPQLFAMARSVKAATKVKSVKLKGNEATAQVAEHAEMVMVNPKTHQTAKLVIEEQSETVWAKGPKGWLKKRSRTLSSKQTVNGKPAPSM